MKDPTKARWFTLLLAIGLLYVGIDRMFFDRIAGGDALAWIARALAIVVGVLLSAVSVSLFVVAWRGRSPVTAMNAKSIQGKLLAYVFCSAPGAIVVGLSLERTIKHFDRLYLTVLVLFGVALISALFWTRREVRRLAASETAKKHATQYLWSYTFFNMLCLVLGMAVGGFNWFSTNFMQRFNVVFWVIMTGVAIYPVRRDARRLADAAGPS
jgi:hypothetical protein